jgi:D-alanyl-D-alanine carboxypeptidase
VTLPSRILFQDGPSFRAARAAREREAKRRRRRHRARLGAAIAALAVAALLAVMASGMSDTTTVISPAAAKATATSKPARSPYGIAPAAHQIQVKLRLALRSGLLFDVRTGHVIWARRPADVMPIASLTKMMTALVVVAHAHADSEVPISKAAVRFTGSGMGVLPVHKQVKLLTLLYGLLLPSGNDAAVALAQYVGGNEDRFIAIMNREARKLQLTCTHFTTVSGVIDQGNHSCAEDLALIAHQLLSNRLLAKIVKTSSAVEPLPIKGGKVWLYNNNPLIRAGYPGIDGVKTGYTTLAGECLVATARRGGHWLGVVLLHSANWEAQAETLLNAGFESLRG